MKNANNRTMSSSDRDARGKGNPIQVPGEDIMRDKDEPWSPDNDLPKTDPPLGDVPLQR
jgi:hypothetical protein